jgi:hypothetical protein
MIHSAIPRFEPILQSCRATLSMSEAAKVSRSLKSRSRKSGSRANASRDVSEDGTMGRENRKFAESTALNPKEE